jgi:AcrR family transcriptional regulator
VDKNLSRREEYAELTRQAVVDAARRLFGEKGYFAATVNEIAAAARVSPATVYSVNGGKQGLLRALIEIWSAAPAVADAREKIEKLDDAAEILRYLAGKTREFREDYGDILRVVVAAAPHDTSAAEGLALAISSYRGFHVFVAERLVALDALRDGVSAEHATDVLWFYLGLAGFFTLVDDDGWSYPKAEKWLLARVTQALLTPSLH